MQEFLRFIAIQGLPVISCLSASRVRIAGGDAGWKAMADVAI